MICVLIEKFYRFLSLHRSVSTQKKRPICVISYTEISSWSILSSICLSYAWIGCGEIVCAIEDNDNRRELWAETRNRGVLWQQAEFGFTSMDEFRVLFQGSVGRTAAGDIAVDDVNISSGRC